VYVEFLFQGGFFGIEDSPNYKYYVYGTQILLLAFAIYLFNSHFKTLRLYNFRIDSTAMLWSMVDFVPLFANIISITITVVKELQTQRYVAISSFNEEDEDSMKNLISI